MKRAASTASGGRALAGGGGARGHGACGGRIQDLLLLPLREGVEAPLLLALGHGAQELLRSERRPTPAAAKQTPLALLRAPPAHPTPSPQPQ